MYRSVSEPRILRQNRCYDFESMKFLHKLEHSVFIDFNEIVKAKKIRKYISLK